MAGEIIVDAALNQLRQQMIRACSFTGMMPPEPVAAAHIMSQSTSCSDNPIIKSYATFSTPPRIG